MRECGIKQAGDGTLGGELETMASISPLYPTTMADENGAPSPSRHDRGENRKPLPQEDDLPQSVSEYNALRVYSVFPFQNCVRIGLIQELHSR